MTFNPTRFSVFATLCASAAAAPVWAEQFAAQSRVTQATIYSAGAEVIRQGEIDLPAGTHDVTFTDVPLFTDVNTLARYLSVQVEGADMGQITVRRASEAGPQTEGAKQAEAALVAARDAFDAIRREVSALEDSAVAAQDSLDFLARLSNEGGQSAEQLAEMASMIRTLSKEARAAIADAQAQKAELKEELDTAQRRLDDARARYAGYFNESVPRAEITVPVRVDDDGTVGFTFEYMAEGGGWTPTYTLHLDTEAEEMRIERKISVSQNTGEAWEDVRLSFSTQTLGGGLSPQDVPPYIRRIEEPMPLPIARDTARSQGMADTLMAAPSFSEMAASPKISNYGLNVTYDLAAPVTLLSDGLQSDFALDDLEVAPEVVLRAVPLFEETAYVMAEFTNESGEALLAGEAMAYRDGAFIGRVDLPMIVEGQETEFGFGAVEGVTVSRVTLDRNEGDRGLIRKSNEDTSAVRLEVENLTGRSWPMEVIDRVSVSEQEDLLINWEASAPPTTVDRDDQRGVLAWEFDLDPSETWNVEVRETLTWPEDKVLR